MSERLDIITILARVFPGVQPQLLTGLLDAGQIREYPDGTILCHQGEREDTLYVLLEGQANVWIYELGEGVLVAYIAAGEPIGELELILDESRAADVVAEGPITVLELDRSMVDLEGCPELFAALARAITKRLVAQQQRSVLQLAETIRQRGELDQIFVCYAHEDQYFAMRLTTDLGHHHINAWLDAFSIVPAHSWARQVGEALDRCPVMLFLMSRASIASDNSEDEWNYYLDQGKPIVPILLEPCHIPYRLNKLQYIDFATLPYDRALTRLVATINSHYAKQAVQTSLGHGATPTGAANGTRAAEKEVRGE